GGRCVRALLDTHALLWALTEPGRLGSQARQVLTDRSHELVVSAASAWEVATKQRIGRLPQADVLVGAYGRHLDRLGGTRLPMTEEHALLAGQLDWSHRDPFDRLLAAQAMSETLTLITRDPAFADLRGIATIWRTRVTSRSEPGTDECLTRRCGTCPPLRDVAVSGRRRRPRPGRARPSPARRRPDARWSSRAPGLPRRRSRRPRSRSLLPVPARVSHAGRAGHRAPAHRPRRWRYRPRRAAMAGPRCRGAAPRGANRAGRAAGGAAPVPRRPGPPAGAARYPGARSRRPRRRRPSPAPAGSPRSSGWNRPGGCG